MKISLFLPKLVQKLPFRVFTLSSITLTLEIQVSKHTDFILCFCSSWPELYFLAELYFTIICPDCDTKEC